MMLPCYFQKGFRKAVVCILLGAGLAADAQVKNTVTPVSYFSDPAISPDGTEIAFVSGGDIWTVPATGGEARLMVSHPDYESRPLYSPDGKYLAFVSTRSGNGDIYVVNMQSGETRRVTYDDAADELSAWSQDGQYLYFSSTSHEVSGMRDVYRIRVDGGTPMIVSGNRYTNEFFAAPSPDGKTVALTAKGVAVNQWWRNGRSHLDESEIWLMHEGKQPEYELVTEGGAKELWPMWTTDGQSIYYVSDKSGAQNLWLRPLKGAPKQLTQFTKGRVLFPSISKDGKTIVFERDFKIWKYDVGTGSATAVSITRHGVPAGPSSEHVRLMMGFRDLAVSPDGKKVAFTAHGEVFVAAAKDGGDAMRVTNTTARESQLVWEPNSNVLIYVSERDDAAHLYQYNFISNKESRLTAGEEDDAAPVLSPNGRLLAFVRDGRELRVLDLDSKKETLITKGYLGRPPFASTGSIAWSPDNKWIAFAGYGAQSLRNIYVVPATGGDAKPVSFLANTFGGNVLWSADGKSVYFTTGQRTENNNIARIDLVPQRPKFREDQFRDLFSSPSNVPSNPASPNTARPVADRTAPADTLFNARSKSTESVKVVFEGIRNRLNLLPVGVDVNDALISRDGKTMIVAADVAGQINLYTYSIDELSREPAVLKQLTSTPGFKTDMQLSSDGKEVYYLEGGRIQAVSLDTKTPRPVAVTAEMDVDFNKEKMEVFREAWEVQNKGFYDPNFHGTNWKEVYATYEPLAAGANTPDELRRLLSLMVGELNASHSGVSGSTPPVYNTGRTGLLFDRTAFEANGKLKITEVISLSPADIAEGINVGDYLTAIDGNPVSKSTNIEQLLENKVNRKVALTITDANGGNEHVVNIRAINEPTEKGLLYKQWVQQQRDYVAKVSGGKLGYVHMFDMSAESLNQLYLDMDAENRSREGVVVDIRNNNGGFVNAYALDVLSRKGYMTMTVRGLPSAPARTQLGQRALEAPTVLVTNRHSLSDAEDFTEGYRTLGLGKVVGEPTGGWIIYTSSASLIDGTNIRLPFIKVTDHEGKDMELHPRPVDIPVAKPLSSDNSKDAQLDAAVKTLLQNIGR